MIATRSLWKLGCKPAYHNITKDLARSRLLTTSPRHISRPTCSRHGDLPYPVLSHTPAENPAQLVSSGISRLSRYYSSTAVSQHPLQQGHSLRATSLCRRPFKREPSSHFYLYNRTRRKDIISRSKSTSPTPRHSSQPQSHSKTSKQSDDSSAVGQGASIPTSNVLLRNRLPDLSNRLYRPTKEELLAAATGFWSRLRVRFKWFSIRSVRPFNSDDISAFFSWILVGHVIWIIVGTTTFFSLLVFTVNTVFAQETLARWVGNYLTKSSGISVIFESAIVPRWKDGVISFKNVFVSRRPGINQADFSKGSQTSAAAAAAKAALAEKQQDAEDSNYTQYDVSIETVNVTLSFTKWFNGKGLLKDVEVKGVRGVLDRTAVEYSTDYIDPRTYKYEHSTGDFELESFKMEDLLVSVYQPGNFRPFSVSVFSADLPQLRKQWLFYDLLSANHISGSFDDSPFFIHPQQLHNQTGLSSSSSPLEDERSRWKKHSRIRVDGLKVDHLNRGIEGPFSWIHDGNVDIVSDVMLPADNDDSIAKVMSDFYDRVEASVTSSRNPSSHSQDTVDLPATTIDNSSTPTETPSTPTTAADPSNTTTPADARFLILDLRIHLNSVRASVPLFTRDLSYVNNALIRPIVAYINNKRASIPISCRVVKRVSEFDGSWTIYDSGLMEDLSRETYDAFERDVVDERARFRRFKKVGLWSLEMAVRALFLGLAGNIA